MPSYEPTPILSPEEIDAIAREPPSSPRPRRTRTYNYAVPYLAAPPPPTLYKSPSAPHLQLNRRPRSADAPSSSGRREHEAFKHYRSLSREARRPAAPPLPPVPDREEWRMSEWELVDGLDEGEPGSIVGRQRALSLPKPPPSVRRKDSRTSSTRTASCRTDERSSSRATLRPRLEPLPYAQPPHPYARAQPSPTTPSYSYSPRTRSRTVSTTEQRAAAPLVPPSPTEHGSQSARSAPAVLRECKFSHDDGVHPGMAGSGRTKKSRVLLFFGMGRCE